MEGITDAVPAIVGSGVGPMILEYIDVVSMAGITKNAGLDLGIPASVKDDTIAYLVVVVEARTSARLDEDVADVASVLADRGAIDVYVLPPGSGTALIEAREKAFWTAKASGANDIIDMVVPRASIAVYLDRVSSLATASGSFIVGCGHAGDGNVHLSVFQEDATQRTAVLHDIFTAGHVLGGAVSGEHGIGSEKKEHFLALEDPAKVALLRRIKAAFDPEGILNPGAIFE
jgi:glycolate oxidase